MVSSPQRRLRFMSQATNQIIRFGVFELDARAGELRRRGMRLSVQGLPLQLLDVLLRHAGEVVTRDELRTQLWPADTFVDFDHSLHNAIARLREALGDSSHSPRFIETLPRRGYRFIGHMEGSPRAKDGEEKTHDIKRTPPAIRWPLRPLLAIGTGFVMLGLGYIA